MCGIASFNDKQLAMHLWASKPLSFTFCLTCIDISRIKSSGTISGYAASSWEILFNLPKSSWSSRSKPWFHFCCTVALVFWTSWTRLSWMLFCISSTGTFMCVAARLSTLLKLSSIILNSPNFSSSTHFFVRLRSAFGSKPISCMNRLRSWLRKELQFLCSSKNSLASINFGIISLACSKDTLLRFCWSNWRDLSSWYFLASRLNALLISSLDGILISSDDTEGSTSKRAKCTPVRASSSLNLVAWNLTSFSKLCLVVFFMTRISRSCLYKTNLVTKIKPRACKSFNVLSTSSMETLETACWSFVICRPANEPSASWKRFRGKPSGTWWVKSKKAPQSQRDLPGHCHSIRFCVKSN